LELILAKKNSQIDQKMLPGWSITHQTTKTKFLHIWPTMAMLGLAQHNNQPTK
jgi:hypothetical protein